MAYNTNNNTDINLTCCNVSISIRRRSRHLAAATLFLSLRILILSSPQRTSINAEKVLERQIQILFLNKLQSKRVMVLPSFGWCQENIHTAVPNSKYAVPVTHPLAPMTTWSIHLSLRLWFPLKYYSADSLHMPLCDSGVSHFTHLNEWITGTTKFTFISFCIPNSIRNTNNLHFC